MPALNTWSYISHLCWLCYMYIRCVCPDAHVITRLMENKLSLWQRFMTICAIQTCWYQFQKCFLSSKRVYWLFWTFACSRLNCTCTFAWEESYYSVFIWENYNLAWNSLILLWLTWFSQIYELPGYIYMYVLYLL